MANPKAKPITIRLTALEARSILLLQPARFCDRLHEYHPVVCKNLGTDKAAARRAAKKIEEARRAAKRAAKIDGARVESEAS